MFLETDYVLEQSITLDDGMWKAETRFAEFEMETNIANILPLKNNN